MLKNFRSLTLIILLVSMFACGALAPPTPAQLPSRAAAPLDLPPEMCTTHTTELFNTDEPARFSDQYDISETAEATLPELGRLRYSEPSARPAADFGTTAERHASSCRRHDRDLISKTRTRRQAPDATIAVAANRAPRAPCSQPDAIAVGRKLKGLPPPAARAETARAVTPDGRRKRMTHYLSLAHPAERANPRAANFPGLPVYI
jgi:hypothetical protein